MATYKMVGALAANGTKLYAPTTSDTGAIAGIVDNTNTTDATSTTAAALKTAGGAGVAKTLFVGNAINISGAAAGQIVFPATQNASSNANTLDDYEEGAWTPTIYFGGATVGVTYGTPYGGFYTKVGRLVTIQAIISLTSKGSSTGDAEIRGLPFAMNSGASAYSAITIRSATVTFADIIMAYVPSNVQYIALQESTNAGAVTAITDADFANTSVLMIGGSYIV